MEEYATSVNNYNLPQCSVRLTRLPVTTSTHATEINKSNSVDLKNHSCEKSLPGEILKDVVNNKMHDYGLKYNKTLMHNIIQEQQSKYVKPFVCQTCKCSFIEERQFLNHGAVCQKNYVSLNTSVDVSNLSNSDAERSKDPFETNYTLNVNASEASRYFKKCFVKLARLSVNLKPTDVVKLRPFSKSVACSSLLTIHDVKSEVHIKIDKHTNSKQVGKENIEFADVYTDFHKPDHAELNMVIETDKEVNDLHKMNVSLGSDTITTTTLAKNTYMCKNCKKGFARAYQLNRHLKSHSDEKPFECRFCQNQYKAKHYLNYHIKSHHLETKENSYCCKVCRKGGFSHTRLKNHMRYHEEKKYKCHLCEWSFSIRGYLKRHLITHTGEKSFTCHLCEKKYTTKSSLLYHLKSHIGDKPFKCSECSKAFIRQSHLKYHLWNVHNTNIDNQEKSSYCCKVCAKRCVTPVHLKMHMRSHMKKYKCHLCEQSFSTSGNFKRHLLTYRHTGEKPFKCLLCEKCYINKTLLLFHMKSHSGEKPFKCNKCDYATTRSYDLNKHCLRKHGSNSSAITFGNFCEIESNAENPKEAVKQEFDIDTNFYKTEDGTIVKAELTNNVMNVSLGTDLIFTETAATNSQKQLQSHEKKHKCHLCEWSFSKRSYLKRHLVKHTGEKSFLCNLCEKGFTRKYRLLSHMKCHTEEKQSVGASKTTNVDYATTLHPLADAEIIIDTRSIVNEECDDMSRCCGTELEQMGLDEHEIVNTFGNVCKIENNAENPKQTCKEEVGFNVDTNLCKTEDCIAVLSEEKMIIETDDEKNEKVKAKLTNSIMNGSLDTDLRFKCSECGKAFVQQSQLKYHLLNIHKKSVDNSENQDEFYYCNICLKRCITPSLLKRHMQCHEKPHKCHLCDSSFPTKTNLKRHLVTHTNDRSFKCHLCDKCYKGKTSLLFHMRLYHTGDKPFKCSECGKAFIQQSQLKYHLWHNHNRSIDNSDNQAEYCYCKVCSKRCFTPLHLKHHSRSHVKPHKCHLCEASFRTKTNLKRHLVTHTGDRSFKCHLCDKCYKGKTSLLYHMRSYHTGDKPFKCSECDKAFILQSKLKYHLWHKHNSSFGNSDNQAEYYYCKVCSKRCITPLHLKRHLQSHEKPHKCNLCESSFPTKTHLKRHLVTHTGEKLFKCHLCEKRYTAKASLLYHLKSHTGEKPFKCNKCDYASKLSKQLKRHRLQKHHSNSLVNTGQAMIVVDDQSKEETPIGYSIMTKNSHECEMCRKRFAWASLLKKHLKIHSDEKPYKCHLCESSFSAKGNLKRHLISHTGERPFRCHLCAKRYTVKDSLLYHMKSHTGEKPFKCNKCDYASKLSKQLKSHYLQEHHSNPLMNTCQATAVVDEQSKEETPCQTINNLHTIKNIDPTLAARNDEQIPPTYNLECKQSAGVNKTANGYSTTTKNFHECEMCKKRFASANLLQTHLRAKSDKKPYECNFCHKRYKHKCHLNDHIKSHNLENQHKCHLCNSSFSRKSILNQHLLIHTGQRPYKCDKCDYAGTRSSDLKRHWLRKRGCNSSVNTGQPLTVVDVQCKEESPCQTINTLHTIKNKEKIQLPYSLDYKQSIGTSKTTNSDYATALHALTVAETITNTKRAVNLNYKECDDVPGCYGEMKNKPAELKQISVEEHEFGDTYINFCKIENNAEGPKQMGKEEIELFDVYTNICKIEDADLNEEKIIL